MSRVNPTPASRSKFDEGRLMNVLVAPVVSEKATMVGEKSNAVTFKVLQDATKPEIKAAVELMFKVEVKGVSVLNTKGKSKVHRNKLIELGMNFNYFTNVYRTKAGKTYYFCYDQGYLELEDDYYALVVKEEYVT